MKLNQHSSVNRKTRASLTKTIAINMTIAFASGCIGGLLNSLVVWFFGTTGLTALLGVKIAPDLTPPWLYPRIIWGGLWGFIFLLPFFQNKYLYRGLLYSLFPSLVQLFIIFPFQANQGIMGVGLGRLTPIFVLFFNFIWGASTALWLKFISDSSESR